MKLKDITLIIRLTAKKRKHLMLTKFVLSDSDGE
jgi:hypothetical protein